MSRRSKLGGADRGYTLTELMVALVVVGVLTCFGMPRFTHALEQSRVDVAAANLRAIWSAQRLYWLKHQTYADSLASLISDPGDGENFVDPNVNSTSSTYVCSITSASATDFTTAASRAGSSGWTCTLSITSSGIVTGTAQAPTGYVYTPSPSFQ